MRWSGRLWWTRWPAGTSRRRQRLTPIVAGRVLLMPGNVEPRYSEFVTFIGIGVDHESDTQLYNDRPWPTATPA